jgi:hypothetical protein
MILTAALAPVTAAGEGAALVVCAPGYPGSTEQAQPTMDAFSAEVARASGIPGNEFRAEYHETAAGGVERIRSGGTVLALVTLPFYLEYGDELGLAPRMQGVAESGSTETWSLAAPKGRIRSPSDLAGWELTGGPGFSPSFVRGPVLEGWGEIPDDVEITFTARALSALRKAAGGEEVAVLLDDVQAGALPSLPFGDGLEIVAASEPLPRSLLCTVGDREERRTGVLLESLGRLHETDSGAAVLQEIRLHRFEPVDAAWIEKWKEPAGR